MVPFVSLSDCFRMIVRISVLVSATTATRCYLYMYATDGILGSASVRRESSSLLMLGRQACAVQNTSNCTTAQCAQGTCSLELLLLLVPPTRPWLSLLRGRQHARSNGVYSMVAHCLVIVYTLNVDCSFASNKVQKNHPWEISRRSMAVLTASLLALRC